MEKSEEPRMQWLERNPDGRIWNARFRNSTRELMLIAKIVTRLFTAQEVSQADVELFHAINLEDHPAPMAELHAGVWGVLAPQTQEPFHGKVFGYYSIRVVNGMFCFEDPALKVCVSLSLSSVPPFTPSPPLYVYRWTRSSSRSPCVTCVSVGWLWTRPPVSGPRSAASAVLASLRSWGSARPARATG